MPPAGMRIGDWGNNQCQQHFQWILLSHDVFCQADTVCFLQGNSLSGSLLLCSRACSGLSRADATYAAAAWRDAPTEQRTPRRDLLPGVKFHFLISGPSWQHLFVPPAL